MNDTIYSLATQSGRGAIAIIRISGEDALNSLKAVFKGEISDHKLCYGMLHSGGTDIDACMAVFMKAPKTYTKEDVCELHIHGGSAVVAAALDALSKFGLRQAEPGEFTKRAFLNGRIDLTEAEAVMSVISARSKESQSAALSQLKGEAGNFVNGLMDRVLNILAGLDVTIDYPEEDIEQETTEQVKHSLNELIKDLKSGISTRLSGQILEGGYKIAIVGRPNVGKSSLLNAVLGKERVIVTDVPGTTRDTLNESYLYKGKLFTISDTAGIRESDDFIEKIGIEKSLEAMKNANLVIVLLDGSSALTAEDKEILHITEKTNRLIVLNKCDLLKKADIDGDIKISAKNGTGLNELLERIYEMQSKDVAGAGLLTASRHIELANKAASAFEEAVSALKDGIDVECVEIHIRDGWHSLGEIVGREVDSAIIDRIFEKFCLGK